MASIRDAVVLIPKGSKPVAGDRARAERAPPGRPGAGSYRKEAPRPTTGNRQVEFGFESRGAGTPSGERFVSPYPVGALVPRATTGYRL